LSEFVVNGRGCLNECIDVNTVLQSEWNGSLSDLILQPVAFGDQRAISGCCEAVVSESDHLGAHLIANRSCQLITTPWNQSARL
jgi:hypothetical protein